VKLTT